VVVAGEDEVDLPRMVSELVGRGLPRVLCEGGPHLLHDMAAAGLLDELCLTVVPHLLAGEHTRILAGAGVEVDLAPKVLVEAEGALLGRWFA
jgi:riboflavin biosynthesis pyrimidine reductase